MTFDSARVRALLSRGETAAADEELAHFASHPSVDWWLLHAEVALLRSDPDAAEAALAHARSDDPTCEVKRHQLAALRWLMLLRLEDADAAASRARSVCVRCSVPVPPSLTAARAVIAIVRDDLDAARVLLDDYPARDDKGEEALYHLVEAAWALRAGRLHDCASLANDAEARIVLGGAPIWRALAAWMRARAAHQVGDLDRADRELRFAGGLCTGQPLTLVQRLCDVAMMLLAGTRGDWEAARAAAHRLLTSDALRPLAIAEASWASDDDVESVRPPWAATAALRRAEHCLATNDLAGADAEARSAEHAFRAAGAVYDRAFALVVRAEALARAAEPAAAQRLLEACEKLALASDYRLVQVRAALVRAYLADRSGDLDGYIAALADAARRADKLLTSAALNAACARVGLREPSPPFAEGQLWREVVRRLGLARPAVGLLTLSDRIYIADGDAWPPDANVRVDLVTGVVAAGAGSTSGPAHLLNLLAIICESGADGVDAEQLYLQGWRASEYHSLRHRNTVYVAVAKLRVLLRRLGLSLRVEGDRRYRIAASRVAVRRPVPARLSEELHNADAPYDPATYALRARISTTQAHWELRLRNRSAHTQ